MTIGTKPPAEAAIDAALVRALIDEQHPGCGIPWPWSIVPWFPGRSALGAPLQEPATVAAALGGFLRALHQPAPADAPPDPWRGVPLAAHRAARSSPVDAR